jgi:oligoribonuclease
MEYNRLVAGNPFEDPAVRGSCKRNKKEAKLGNPLIWIDLEMTGLDIEKHVILEIAAIITNDNLEIVAQGPDIAISHPEHILSSIDEWSLEHHQASGLMDRVKASSHSSQSAEEETLDFLSLYCKKDQSPLCGNSVWQDRRFLSKYMPSLEAFPHYRNIDVSSVKELVKRWYPTLAPFEKEKTHRAMSDIRESIKELMYYRKNVFI